MNKHKTLLVTILKLYLIIFATNMSAQHCDSYKAKLKHNFILLKTKGISIDTTVVKTNGVYISTFFRINLDKTQQDLYSFYRFFDNGKFYNSYSYCSPPSEKECNELNYGSYGEYRIENNQIIIEYFASYVGYYLSYYTQVDNNTIIETHTSKRKFKGKIKLNPSISSNQNEFHKCELTTKSFW